MTGTPVSIADVLEARDRRAEAQHLMLQRSGCPLISFTMNIPGEIKRFPASDLAFYHGVELLTERLGEPFCTRSFYENTGLEMLLSYKAPADKLKEVCESIENSSPVGRLYDMDVIGQDGVKLSRAEARRCIVCGGPVSVCSRSRSHGLETITNKVQQLLKEYVPLRLSYLAERALIEEASLSPKPGLVDANNNGAHTDMDLQLFIKSSRALRPYFFKVAEIAALSDDCMPELMNAGIEAERVMFEATGGVNTHKGAIYNLGLITAALSACSQRGGDPLERAAALALAGTNIQRGSHGELVREKYGSGGARVEACSGFPSAAAGLRSLNNGEAPLDALMRIILVCNDTNILFRAGEDGLAYARHRAEEYLSAPGCCKASLINDIDRDFIKRNISPGGSADMLAVAFLLKYASCLYE